VYDDRRTVPRAHFLKELKYLAPAQDLSRSG